MTSISYRPYSQHRKETAWCHLPTILLILLLSGASAQPAQPEPEVTPTTSLLQRNTTSGDTNSTTAKINYDVMKSPWLRGFFILLYCIIFVLGVSGNSLVVYIVVHNKAIQTITNIFICNLALSDIMMCLLAVPFTPLSAFLNSWIFGDALCHIVPMTLGVSVYVSTLTSTAIAVDRYFVIVHPFKPRMKVFVCLMLIVAIWVVSVSISLPLAIYQKVSWVEHEQAYICYEHWPKTTARQFFTVTSLILQYIVPCSVITFCYAKVSLVLRARARAKLGQKSRDREQMDIQRKRRTNRMLIAMVTIFVCCWLPLNVVHVTQEYHQMGEDTRYFLMLFFVAHVTAMSSTIYNPFLYAWMNESFRNEFKTIMPFAFRSAARGGKGGAAKNANGGASQYATVDTQNSFVNRSPVRTDTGAGTGNATASASNTAIPTTVAGNGKTSPTDGATYDAESNRVHLAISEGEAC
ncbi:hypothetical protein NP493_887g01004 [Ridgeia piscesae]|uniref:G-protein coupled receptors family 1 profile domain-containing protein n=1 Tax=Ridgeia piscesae TaxID=27915 RepID=A0AAD9KLD2_RIDPI|nr:hypothetical protein NP493_887g01004 [Ridgeia piscesae]